MSWDEKLFGLLFRRVRGLNARASSPHEVTLQPRLVRLEMLATGIAGKRVEVRATEGEGFIRSDGTLSLPEAFDVFESTEKNANLYLLRTAFAAMAFKLGLAAGAQMDRTTARAYTVGVAPLVVRALSEEFLGLRTLWIEYAAALKPRLTALLEQPANARLGNLLALGFDPEVPEAAELRSLFEELRARSTDVSTFARWLTRDYLKDSASAVPYVQLYGWLAVASGDAFAVDDPGAASPIAKKASERKGKNREAVRRLQLRPAEEENPFTHSFEKTETLEEYKGGSKKVDGSDEMSSHGEALDELNLQEVVRSDQQAHSVYRADVLMDVDVAHVADAAPTSERSVVYDEWDHASKAYRKDFCTVRVVPAAAAAATVAAEKRAQVRRTHRAAIDRLTGSLARHFSARAWETGLLDGTEIDLDRLSARHAALRAGANAGDRLYMSRIRPITDLSLVILVDTSLSSDSWVNNQRVLDVAIDSLYLLAEVIEPFDLDCVVGAFDSRTRRDCAFREIKTSRTSWRRMRERAAALAPSGYTRIGPALRHAKSIFEDQRGVRRLLLVLSDAKPSDYDRYEGRYGVADVKQAIRELRAIGAVTHLFALDDGNSPSWKEMFGTGGYSVVPNVLGLASGMTRALAASLR